MLSGGSLRDETKQFSTIRGHDLYRITHWTNTCSKICDRCSVFGDLVTIAKNFLADFALPPSSTLTYLWSGNGGDRPGKNDDWHRGGDIYVRQPYYNLQTQPNAYPRDLQNTANRTYYGAYIWKHCCPNWRRRASLEPKVADHCCWIVAIWLALQSE